MHRSPNVLIRCVEIDTVDCPNDIWSERNAKTKSSYKPVTMGLDADFGSCTSIK